MTLAFVVEVEPNVFRFAAVIKEEDGGHECVDVRINDDREASRIRALINTYRVFDIVITPNGRSFDLAPVEDEDWQELN